MRPLYKHLKEHLTNDNKSLLEIILLSFKVLFYGAVTSGVIWNILYFGFVVNVLPNFDASSIVGYLISIFGIGILLIFVFILIILLPGLLFWLMTSGKGRQNIEVLKNPLLYVYIWLSFYVSIKLLPNISYDLFSCKVLLEEIFAIIVTIIFTVLLFKKFNIIEWIKSWKDFNRAKENFFWVIAGVVSCFMFLAGVAVIIAFTIIAIDSYEIANYKALLIYILILFMFFSFSIINAIISAKGPFIESGRNFIPTNVAVYLLIASIMIACFSIIGSIVNKPNLFLIAPYKFFKIGEIHAKLFFDEKYIEKIGLATSFDKTKMVDSSTAQNVKCFEILSSIGNEYIVKPSVEDKCKPQDSKAKQTTETLKRKQGQDKSETREHRNKFEYEYILRIPKDKVLLVEYIEKKNSK